MIGELVAALDRIDQGQSIYIAGGESTKATGHMLAPLVSDTAALQANKDAQVTAAAVPSQVASNRPARTTETATTVTTPRTSPIRAA